MQESTCLPSTSTQRLRLQFSSPDGRGKIIYTAILPVIEGHKKINSFYQRTVKKCEEYCKEKLPARCAKQKANEPSWEYSYKISCKVAVSEGNAEITLSASLYDRGMRRTVSAHTESHLWSLENDRLSRKPKQKAKKE